MWFPSVAFAAMPDIDEPHRSAVTNRGDTAVVVGIEDYFVLPDVPYATRDAEAFYDFAVYTRGIPSDRVTLMTGPVSREKLSSALQAAGKSTAAGGTVFVYFAGHGAASPSTGERILVGADAQADLETFQARAVTVADVRSWVTSGGGAAVLVLDTCYSGRSRAGGDLVAGKRFAVPAYAMAPAANVVEWTAAGPDQWSGPLDSARHGAFTYLAIGAMRGWADGQRDGVRDGTVTVEEASLYVEEGLRTLQIRDQRPERVGEGTMVLSKGKEPAPVLTPPVAPAPVAAAPQPATPAPAPVSYGEGPGQIMYMSMSLVTLYVDGVMRLVGTTGSVRIDDLAPGPHLVEIKNGFNKTLVEQDVVVPPGTQLRLQYKDKTLRELSRGPVDKSPPPADPMAPAVFPSGGPPAELRAAPPRALPGGVAMHVQAMKAIPMSDAQLEYLRGLAMTGTFTCAEAAELVAVLQFSEKRVAAAQALSGSIVDPQNLETLLTAFRFESERTQVRAMFGR